MNGPIALGRSSLPLSPPQNEGEKPARMQKMGMQWGANALTAPSTPGHRMAVVDRSQVDPQIRQAAEGLETMFLDYMMKIMRQTVPKNDMDLESPATEIYRSMQDSEIAQRTAHGRGIGLSDQIIAYLESQRYTLNRSNGMAQKQTDSKVVGQSQVEASTGGTDARKPIE